MAESSKKKDWILSSSAFSGLLKWLDRGVDSEGRSFLEMRRRLVSYFDRKGCQDPDELADETLNRIARRLEEESEIETETPAKFCYIVARFVFLESFRATNREETMPSEIRLESPRNPEDESAPDRKELLLNCLEQCTERLDAAQRDLIIGYYFGREKAKIESRRQLAKTLGITINALSIRACRIRDKLEDCVTRCVEAK